MNIKFCGAALAAACLLLSACGSPPQESTSPRTFTVRTEGSSGAASDAPPPDGPALGPVPDDAVPLSGAPPAPSVLSPSAPGTAEEHNPSAVIDFSNAADGYVMAKWTEGGEPKLKTLVKGPGGVSYQYNLRTDGVYEVFPLSDGSGPYTVGVYKNVGGKEYAAVLSASFDAPPLRPVRPLPPPQPVRQFQRGQRGGGPCGGTVRRRGGQPVQGGARLQFRGE